MEPYLRQQPIGATTPSRQPEIPAAMENLEKTISQLDDWLNLLHERLSPILTVGPSNPVGGKEAGHSSNTALANAIHNQAGRVAVLCSRAQDIINGIEL